MGPRFLSNVWEVQAYLCHQDGWCLDGVLISGKMAEAEEGPLVTLLISLLVLPPRVFQVPRAPLVLQEKRWVVQTHVWKRGCLVHGSYFCPGLGDLLDFTGRHVRLALQKVPSENQAYQPQGGS